MLQYSIEMKNRTFYTIVLFCLIAGFTLMAGCSSGETSEVPGVRNISVKDAYDFIHDNSQNPGFRIIDVRTPSEFTAGFIPGAINMDINAPDFDTRLAGLSKTGKYLVYCRSGARSQTASRRMIDMGFTDVSNLLGGFDSWQSAGYAVEKP